MKKLIPIKSDHQIEKAAQLAAEIWTEHYTPIIGTAQVKYMLEKFQSPVAISKQIAEENFEYFFIEDRGKPVGYIAVQPKSDCLYLSKFYINASCRGKGLGKTAMQFIEDSAKEKGLPKINLNVNRNNHNTIKAYEKMGFSKCDTVEINIGEGFAMCDYVMEKVLK